MRELGSWDLSEMTKTSGRKYLTRQESWSGGPQEGGGHHTGVTVSQTGVTVSHTGVTVSHMGNSVTYGVPVLHTGVTV